MYNTGFSKTWSDTTVTTAESYAKFLEDLRKEPGLAMAVPDAGGLVSLRVDDKYNLNLQLVEASARILCFVEVASIPHDAPAGVYRDLLAAGLFGKETAGGYFAIERDTGTLVYNYFFDLAAAAADTDDFVSTLEKILQLCDMWAERVKSGLYGEDGSEGADAGGGHVRHRLYQDHHAPDAGFRIDP